MDLNQNCLDYVKNILKDKQILTYQIDILKDIPEKFFSKYYSISCNYLIHCLLDNGNKKRYLKILQK